MTAGGRPEQAAVVAGACAGLPVPVVTVLGNHDHDAGLAAEVASILRDAGVVVLDGDRCVLDVRGIAVGVVGATGHPGGFPGVAMHGLSERGRSVADERAAAHARAIDDGLHGVADCATRIVLLHYAPTTDTLAGEDPALWGHLGSQHLATPIAAHAPDLVLHAHAHAGSFRGAVAGVPVYNVSSEVLGRELCLLELAVGVSA
ncbi:MAG: hypothetical protein QOD81_2514 [Solirubrobacteraceae bacterium]|nr:hypothetical protein [Solirubrobacteraceae bacterium]